MPVAAPSKWPILKVVLAVAALAAGLGGIVYYWWGGGADGPSDNARYTMCICSETGNVFRHQNKEGETPPFYSPASGKNTGYTAEACYWNADGTIKKDPTYVLLNAYVGKPGPTFCPDCGRLVIGHNPRPTPGRQPPPTADEYRARRSR